MTVPETPPPPGPRSQLQQEAATWFSRMHGPNAEDHRAEFETWLARGALHEHPAVLDEMLTGRKTRKFVQRRLSPTIAIAALPGVADSARDDPWQRLMKELRGAGYVPRFSSELIPEEVVKPKENGNASKSDVNAANGSPPSSASSNSNGPSNAAPTAAARRRRTSSRNSA